MSGTRTRFAPSPTGDLHLGGALTALASWLLARRAGGSFVLRVEDLDRPRVVVGAEERQREDLLWLGLISDEGPDGGPYGPYRQSQRSQFYAAALADLTALGRTYPCDCSRAEIATVASAPHAGDEVVYPGTCRDEDPSRSFRRAPALRLAVDPTDRVTFVDQVMGEVSSERLHALGDFVLQRGDGVYSYQLAVSADDLSMRITDVVRGVDLLPSALRQLLLMRLWQESARLPWATAPGTVAPRYWHLPLVTDASGERLAKRTRGATLRELRAAGAPATVIVGQLAFALGLQAEPSPITPADLASQLRGPPLFRRDGWRFPVEWSAIPRPGT